MFEAIWQWIKSINKKVWITAALVATVFTVGTTWIVVANYMAAFKPVSWVGLDQRQRQTVFGNGGPAVMVGNWLYFVDGYVDASSLRYRQNEHNKVKHGAIYRVYIDPAVGAPWYENSDKTHTQPEYTPHLLERARRELGDSGKGRPYQIVVPKVAGFESAALWVFDKHLVYTSPNNTKDKYGQMQLDKIDFFRVDLSGKNHRKIYTTSNEGVTLDNFTVASYGLGQVFLLIRDGDMLRRVAVAGKNAGKVTTVTRAVQTVALPVVTSYQRDYTYNATDKKWEYNGDFDVVESYRGVMSHVYYTESFDEDEQKLGLRGNKVFQYDVKNNTKVEVPMNGHRVGFLALANGRLVYSVRVDGGDSLGLFMTEQVISSATKDKPAITDPFDVAIRKDRTKFMDDFKVLQSSQYQLGEEVYLPTVHTPWVVFRFVTLAEENMYIYERGNQEPVSIVEGVSSIITITGSTVHYMTSGGDVRAVDLNNGNAIEGMGSFRPETDIRPWVIATRGQAVWHFQVRTFSTGDVSCDADDHTGHDHSGKSTTVAMLHDLFGGRAFILGRIDCQFVDNGKDCCD